MPRTRPTVGTSLVAAATAVGLSLISTASLAGPAAAASSQSPATYQSSTITYTNVARVGQHRAKVTAESCLQSLAVAQAKRMAAQQKLVHQDLRPVLSRCHDTQVAENIAVGFPTGKSVVNAWMHSPGHRANILHGAYQRIGVGAVQDSHGRWWVSELFGRA